MKYFNNITTAEELKKQFRAYCVSMHPDKGGDPEEFKQMLCMRQILLFHEYKRYFHFFLNLKKQ